MGIISWLRGRKHTEASELTSLLSQLFENTWTALTVSSETLMRERVGNDPHAFCVHADFAYGVLAAGFVFAEEHGPPGARKHLLDTFREILRKDLARKNPALATVWLETVYVEPNLSRLKLNAISRIGYAIAVRWLCNDAKEGDAAALLDLLGDSGSSDNLQSTIWRLSKKYPMV